MQYQIWQKLSKYRALCWYAGGSLVDTRKRIKRLRKEYPKDTFAIYMEADQNPFLNRFIP